jgi:GH43 family beta-xylosidase
LTYLNPVFPDYFADPFVLKHDGQYYAYGTAPGQDGGELPILHSTDLVNWNFVGWAIYPKQGIEFWAPEVAYHEGKFYLYYSARGIEDRDHQLTVAISERPEGPFEETGKVLVPDEPFSIDAHPFQDSDGQWYLFYSQDFLTLDGDDRVGTGIVVDRLVDMTTLAGDARVVVRPHLDWHLFRKERQMYGAVYDWYTVEGASVLKHNGLYYCFYSGGAWEYENYGVSYVVAEHPLGPYRRPEEAFHAILKSVPERMIGPGHNSFTVSPNGEEQFIVYHAWDTGMTGRRMCIDRFHWNEGIPTVEGPTWTPQPAPR